MSCLHNYQNYLEPINWLNTCNELNEHAAYKAGPWAEVIIVLYCGPPRGLNLNHVKPLLYIPERGRKLPFQAPVVASTSLHDPAAFVSSVVQTRNLVASIIGSDPQPPSHLDLAISALSEAAGRPDWVSMEEIDVPLRQRPLSRSIDEAVFTYLCESAPDTRSRALALSSSLPHAGDWLNVIPCILLSRSTSPRQRIPTVFTVLAGSEDGRRADHMSGLSCSCRRFSAISPNPIWPKF